MILLKLFLTFLKIGTFTFGGGYAMLPLVQDEVAANGWMTNEELINFIAISESTPGPFAVNVSTYVGMETAGILGAICATLGVVMPSFIIILIIAGCFEKFKENAVIKGSLSGLKPAVIGLIGTAVVSTGATVFFPTGVCVEAIFGKEFICSAIIFAGMIVLAVKKVHPIIIILLSALLGILTGMI